MNKSMWLVVVVLVAAGVVLTGCPKEPALSVSPKSLHFGIVGGTVYETTKTFQVWNSGAAGTTVVFTVSANKGSINVDPTTSQSTGEDNKITITVTIDRAYVEDAKAADYASGVITVEAGFANDTVAVTTAPDYYTEAFSAGMDLDHLKLTFTPSGGLSFYSLETAPITDFPTDPAGGLVLDFDAFGDPVKAAPFGDEQVPFYGKNYDTLYISSQGWVSFGQPGNDPTTLGNHFKVPQISALVVDATQPGSMVSFLQDADKLIITYENVPTQDPPGGTNNFQIELFFDGTLQLSYLDVDPAMVGVIGLSSGAGQAGLPPSDFLESDLNTAPIKAALN